MSSLSSRDASCLFKPDMHLRQAGLRAESISGMENESDPLQRGSPGDTVRTSALNSNTASFSDEQLVGSQERVAGPLTMTTGLSLENTNQQVMRLKCSNELNRRKIGDKFGIVGEHSMKNSDETATGHVKKRRRIFDEFESIKDVQFEGKRIFQEAEKKLTSLQNTLLQPMIDGQIGKETLPEPVNKTNMCGNSDWLSQTRKTFPEAEVIEQAGDSNVQMEVDKLFVPTATQTRESPQLVPVPERVLVPQLDSLMSFEQMLNGDYMKILDLDNTVAEESFRMAMERPLSPIPPEYDLLEFGHKVGAELRSVPLSRTNEATYQHVFSVHNENQLYFTLFSDMDTSSMARIYSATKTCVSRCYALQTKWPVKDMLGVLLLEKDLIPREKACVLFSLMLFNITAGSSGKSLNFHSQEQMDSFSAHISTVLFDIDTRDLCARICDLRELLTLSEDFVFNRKVMCNNDVTCELLDGCGSCFEILLEGGKLVLWPKMASTTLVVAATIVLASISKAVGLISFVCEVSLKVLQIGRTDYSLALTILHTFAYMCGEKYVTIGNDSLDMKVVKSVVTFMEGSVAKQPNKNCQSSDTQFTPCVRCPFSEGSVLLDNLSTELLEELQRCVVPQPAVSAQSSNREALTCFLSDILSSLELIASIMAWDHVCNSIVPELLKKLKSSHQDRVFSTALVALLGYIGRLGVEGHGYEDPGVEGIKNHLLDLLQTVASKCNASLSMAIVYELIGLYPKGHEMFQKGNNVEPPSDDAQSAASNIIRGFLSSLSNEQTTSLAGLMKLDTGVHA